MEEIILKKKLEEIIAGRKITAAIFYTYNFETRFFENYLLPLFLPDVPFNNNEIQNAILWRHYQKELPPITVYCDFFAKDKKDAPSLGYDIRTIALEINDLRRPAFHPKLSYLLLEDSSLIAITGSNNLSLAAWTSNLEAFSITEFRNGEYYPRNIKDDYKKFMDFVNNLYGKEYTDAEKPIRKFFNRVLYTNRTRQHKDNYSSVNESLFDKLEMIKGENHSINFKSAEIITPYFSSVDVVKNIKKYVDGDIKISIPFSANNTVSISKKLFESFESEDILWSDINMLKNEKVFRPNHSKVFRFYGEDKVFTFIGSANLSGAALNGYQHKGNIEFSAIFHDKISNNEKDLLKTRSSYEDLIFDMETEEPEHDERKSPPDLYFTLDWSQKKLIIENPNKIQAIIYLSDSEKVNLYEGRKKSNTTIDLSYFPDSLKVLADNSAIKVKYEDSFFEFYPKQLFIGQRPLSSKIKIDELELINLWRLLQVDVKIDKTKITNYIERIIDNKFDEFGNEKLKKENNKSVLNYMAMHLSAIIGLEKMLFKECTYRSQRDINAFNSNKKSLIKYYLLEDNVDTLTGYRRMITEKYNENKIVGGFYWLLLKIISQKLYVKSLTKSFLNDPNLKKVFNKISKELANEIRSIENSIKVDSQLLIWVEKNL